MELEQEQEHKCKRTVALCMTEQWRLEMENGDRRMETGEETSLFGSLIGLSSPYLAESSRRSVLSTSALALLHHESLERSP